MGRKKVYDMTHLIVPRKKPRKDYSHAQTSFGQQPTPPEAHRGNVWALDDVERRRLEVDKPSD